MAHALDIVIDRQGQPLLEGSSADLINEREMYIANAADGLCVHRICEIGFNGGHSAGLWLRANPHAEVLMFDLWSHQVVADRAEAFLRNPANGARWGLGANASARLKIVRGDSQFTVPQFYAQHPEIKCDVLSVDGGHSALLAKGDLMAMANLAATFNVLFLDDTNCQAGYCYGPNRALAEVMNFGNFVRVLATLSEGPTSGRNRTWSGFSRGLTVMQYIRPAQSPVRRTLDGYTDQQRAPTASAPRVRWWHARHARSLQPNTGIESATDLQ